MFCHGLQMIASKTWLDGDHSFTDELHCSMDLWHIMAIPYWDTVSVIGFYPLHRHLWGYLSFRVVFHRQQKAFTAEVIEKISHTLCSISSLNCIYVQIKYNCISKFPFRQLLLNSYPAIVTDSIFGMISMSMVLVQGNIYIYIVYDNENISPQIELFVFKIFGNSFVNETYVENLHYQLPHCSLVMQVKQCINVQTEMTMVIWYPFACISII